MTNDASSGPLTCRGRDRYLALEALAATREFERRVVDGCFESLGGGSSSEDAERLEPSGEKGTDAWAPSANVTSTVGFGSRPEAELSELTGERGRDIVRTNNLLTASRHKAIY